MSWFLAFAGFAVLIMLHEAGHFAAAKAVGMRVERFSLFFPPFLARKTIGETEYTIGALPLGGYVKITGMNPDQELPEEVRDRAYHAQPVWKRMVVIAAGPFVNLVLALLLLFVFFWQVGPREYAVDALHKGYPAAEVLEPGDDIVAVDGRRVDINTEAGQTAAVDRVASHRCAETPPTPRCKATTPVALTVERDGKTIPLRITPIYDPQSKRTRLGFAYGLAGPRDPLAFGAAWERSLDRFWFVTRETVKLPLRLIDAEKRKEVSSAVGIVQGSSRALEAGFRYYLYVLALISLSLALLNLLPLLPLDGGHITFSIIEGVRGRSLGREVYERVSLVGIALVLFLFAIGLSNDINRLNGG